MRSIHRLCTTAVILILAFATAFAGTMRLCIQGSEHVEVEFAAVPNHHLAVETYASDHDKIPTSAAAVQSGNTRCVDIPLLQAIAGVHKLAPDKVSYWQTTIAVTAAVAELTTSKILPIFSNALSGRTDPRLSTRRTVVLLI